MEEKKERSFVKELLLYLILMLGVIGVLLAASRLLPTPKFETLPVKNTAFTDRVQNSVKGVVHIMCPQWQGSGFVIGPNLIVTARHCVEGVTDFTITTHDGHVLKATRAISDKNHDVAFIWIDDLTCVVEKERELKCDPHWKVEHNEWVESSKVKLHPLRLGSIKDCRLGQNIYVIGSPFGKINFNALSAGVISGVDRDWSFAGDSYGWKVAFTIDSAGHPGNSGCPVFTMDGKVRGILVGGFSPVLISVMPCDLFLSDLEIIERMFTQDKYYKEEAVVGQDEWYNYIDGNEYY
jgi:S1-C subfamily serine protease